MISTHFPLSFPPKIDMFSQSPLFVNHMSVEWSLLPAAGGQGSFEPPVGPGQSPGGDQGEKGKRGKSS